MIWSPFRRGGSRSRGQALVEFAFVLPIFLLLLMSLIDFGRVIYAQHTINQDAAEGARVGAVSADSLATNADFTARYLAIRNAALVMAPAVPMTPASISGDPANTCAGVIGAVGGTPAMPNDAVVPADATVTNSCFYPNGVNNSNPATPPRIFVKVSVTVPLITPIISNILGGSIPLNASSSQLLQ